MTGKRNAHARVRVTTLITSLEDPAAWLSGQFRREFCQGCAASAQNPESELDAPPPAVSREPSLWSGLGPSHAPRRFPGRSVILEPPPRKRCPPSLPRGAPRHSDRYTIRGTFRLPRDGRIAYSLFIRYPVFLGWRRSTEIATKRRIPP